MLKLIRTTVVIAPILTWACVASASGQGMDKINDVYSGNCIVRASLTEPVLEHVELLIDDTQTTARPWLRSGSVEFSLLQPLHTNSIVKVAYESRSAHLPGHREVQVDVKESGRKIEGCKSPDERGSFVPSLFLGVVADGFAPNEHENYPAGTTYPFKTKMASRLDAQLRVGGNRGTWLDRLWLGVDAVYGVRSSDLDCTSSVDQQSPACDPSQSAFTAPSNPGASFTSNVLRASKIEATFKPRIEFWDGQLGPDARFTLFLGARLGFGQTPNDAKPANIYSAGGGFVISGGPFRDSGLSVMEGVDRGYRTNPAGPRTRMDFRFLFDALPGFKDQLPFVPHTNRSIRGLIEVVIDRNFGGEGPDAFQTYLGVVIDFRQLLVKVR